MSENHIYILYQSNDNEEIRIQGSPRLVGEFMRAYVGDENININEFMNVEEAEGVLWSMEGKKPQSKPNLTAFFISLSPKNRTDEVVIISYYYHKFLDVETLSLEHYEEAYKELKLVPVSTPSNMKSNVRNVVDRTDYLRNPSRGMFALTLEGEKYVRNLRDGKVDTDN